MKRSKHSLSGYNIASGQMGFLYPICMREVLPGDTFQQSSKALLRFQPMLAPVMHPVHVRIHHWFVPLRIIWSGFEEFITGGAYGSTPPVHPYVNLSGAQSKASLNCYLGIPGATTLTGTHSVSALPMRAYGKIWNECYRDQDLSTAFTISTGSGQDTTTNATLASVAWSKDYFTTARPWAQKDTPVSIPMTDGTPLVTRISGSAAQTWKQSGTNTAMGDAAAQFNSGVLTNGTNAGSMDPNGTLEVDVGTAMGNITDLWEAIALQKYAQARARYGSRFTEYLRYLGVRSSDARLQRPEYLGGGSQTVAFSEVVQTGPTDTTGTDPQGVGNMLGHGLGAVRSNRYRRFFEEHGIVMSLMSIVPIPIYQESIDRMWLKTTKEDYWQRELQHVGQQEILQKEVNIQSTSPTSTFGFVDRYDEYRRGRSTVAGDFSDTLDFWHLARQFGATGTALNSQFVECSPSDRIFATGGGPVTGNDDQLWWMVYNSIQARRLISQAGTPSGV